MTDQASLKPLDRLVGRWTFEATHPSMPGVVVRGTADIEWLEGERFLVHRARNDHPDFPDSISIIGVTAHDRTAPGAHEVAEDAGPAPLSVHYYDSRGVFREMDAAIDDTAWRMSRMAPGFSQRFTGTFTEDGDAIVGIWQMCNDDVHWNDDLAITYRRSRAS
jgi:hypothetical protein